jgi:hypothetical protein
MNPPDRPQNGANGRASRVDSRRGAALVPVLLVCACLARTLAAQEEIASVRELAFQGTVHSVIGDLLYVTDADGKTWRFLFQTDPLRPIMLTGGSVPLNAPARIRVTGKLSPRALQPGMVVEFQCRLTRSGQVSEIRQVKLHAPGAAPAGVTFTEGEPAGGEAAAAVVMARITAVNDNRLSLRIPRHERAQRDRLQADLGQIDSVEVDFGLAGMIRRGDIVRALNATEVSTGDLVVRRLDVELAGLRDDPKLTVDQQLQLKYADLSTDPVAPRDERSRHFLMRTDLSEQRTAILLEKLETMTELVGDYYGRQPSDPIQCVVASDLTTWNVAEFPERAVMKIRNGEGMTVYERIGRQQRAVVFSAATDAVVQHESVHGFCFLVYGQTGPLWYAEGMAEVGRFWVPGSTGIFGDPAIIGYLRDAPPKPIEEIVRDAEVSGELWKPYAWRWLLCHMLVNNPNYSRDFRRFGIDLMAGKAVDFETEFAPVGRQLAFEFALLLEHVNAGLEAERIAWDWNTKSQPLPAGRPVKVNVRADRGWQPAGVDVQAGNTYRFESTGQWNLDGHSPAVGAAGMSGGDGMLVGVLMSDFQLSEEFEIGEASDWTAPASGTLYLRCREAMAALADNSGEITVTIAARE